MFITDTEKETLPIKMKLTKSKLIESVRSKMESLDFTEFKNTKSGFQGLFVKRVAADLYLTLGLTIHRYYESAFTADYYLSSNTVIGAVWGDIPKECYVRIGFLLNDDERMLYPADNINVRGNSDIWWYGDEEQSVIDFLRVVKLTEKRFIQQPDLIRKIRNSQEIKFLSDYAERVKAIAIKEKLDGVFHFIPVKEVNGIPLIWFRASEKVINDSHGILNSHTVIRLATDAFIQYQLDKGSYSGL